jgi:hypothetical protein
MVSCAVDTITLGLKQPKKNLLAVVKVMTGVPLQLLVGSALPGSVHLTYTHAVFFLNQCLTQLDHSRRGKE